MLPIRAEVLSLASESLAWHQKSLAWHQKSLAWHQKSLAWHQKSLAWHQKSLAWHQKSLAWHQKSLAWHQKSFVRHQKSCLASKVLSLASEVFSLASEVFSMASEVFSYCLDEKYCQLAPHSIIHLNSLRNVIITCCPIFGAAAQVIDTSDTRPFPSLPPFGKVKGRLRQTTVSLLCYWSLRSPYKPMANSPLLRVACVLLVTLAAS